jgi:fumarylacetoacetase
MDPPPPYPHRAARRILTRPRQSRIRTPLHRRRHAAQANRHSQLHRLLYASIDHATRVGQLFRPEKPLLANYKHIPIGYHGRASFIIVPSGDPYHSSRRPDRRPTSSPEQSPQFAATRSLDYELELAFYVGQPSTIGIPVPIDDAAHHLFGVSLLNDWSARDLQSWEYQPLGPFLAKDFATTMSPWVTPMAALEPFRIPAKSRPKKDPSPLPYLHSSSDQRQGSFDVKLEVFISTPSMRKHKLHPLLINKTDTQHLYWTPAQLVAHQTSNGCNLQIGDILATGTISGPEESSAGCLLELTRNASKPLVLATGESRTFLLDGDEIILRGYCKRPGHARIGLGECRGTIHPARA